MWNASSSFSKQEIVFDYLGRIIDLGSGKFNFGYRFKSGQLDFCLPISQSDEFTWFWSVRSLSEAKVVHCVPGDSLFLNVAGPNSYTIKTVKSVAVLTIILIKKYYLIDWICL